MNTEKTQPEMKDAPDRWSRLTDRIAQLEAELADSRTLIWSITHDLNKCEPRLKDCKEKLTECQQHRDGLADALEAGNHFICLIPNEIKLGSETRIIAYQKYLDALAGVQDE